MLIVGITGNIGSGKTTVCKIFSVLAVPVYEADKAAIELMQHDAVLKANIITEFGFEVYENKNLNKKLLAEKVFSDKNALVKLNNLVHPVVKKDFAGWLNSNTTSRYVIFEAAILFESGSNEDCNIAIVVTSPDELRFNRVINRDKVSKEQVLARENNQIKQDEKRKLANFEIINDEKKLLTPQVLKLHEHFLTLSKK